VLLPLLLSLEGETEERDFLVTPVLSVDSFDSSSDSTLAEFDLFSVLK
jgi:hypothetical protein